MWQIRLREFLANENNGVGAQGAQGARRARGAQGVQGALSTPSAQFATSMGIFGTAEFLARPCRLDEAVAIFRLRSSEWFPLYIIGGGTNVLPASGVIDGLVLSSERLDSLVWRVEGDALVLVAGAGCPLSSVVSTCAALGFTGAEFALGIPGTVGGAVAGNAGALGASIGDVVEEITSVEPDGSVARRREGFECSYRFCSLASPDRLLASVVMRFRRAVPGEIEEKTETFRRAREKQPRERSAGCAFKNPPSDAAGRLLDSCGCKGLRVGDAAVSDVHANFIVNRGAATGEDVAALMGLCRDRVFRRTGVLLEPEVKFIGFGSAEAWARAITTASMPAETRGLI
ncbi:MAG: UDP-N-acetylmuramate dehydrogenase [Synergistaceae bacterium]|nr:UDP-N-acetylmuramate dehydrogenase [Synergistaceae bacterium]